MKVKSFSGKKIHSKNPASQYHPGALAVLVRYNQAQKSAFSMTLNASNRLLLN